MIDTIEELIDSEIHRPVARKFQRSFRDFHVTRDDGLTVSAISRALNRPRLDPIAKQAAHRKHCAEYRAANREKVRASRRNYYVRNRERLLAERRTETARQAQRIRAAEYRAKNKSKLQTKRKARREKEIAYGKEYREFQKLLRYFVRNGLCKTCLKRLRALSTLENIQPLERDFFLNPFQNCTPNAPPRSSPDRP